MEGELKCKMAGCVIAKTHEDMRLFRQAIVQFLVTPAVHITDLKMMAMSLKAGIDEWYEPHTENYNKEEQDGDSRVDCRDRS